MWPANLGLFIYIWPIAWKQLNSLTTIITLSGLDGAKVTHPLWVRKVPGSVGIPILHDVVLFRRSCAIATVGFLPHKQGQMYNCLILRWCSMQGICWQTLTVLVDFICLILIMPNTKFWYYSTGYIFFTTQVSSPNYCDIIFICAAFNFIEFMGKWIHEFNMLHNE